MDMPGLRECGEIDGDAAMVAAVCSGRPHGMEALMRHYNRRLYRVARSILRDDAEAEDALQDAYLKAYAAMGSFRFESRLSTWLTRIVINECLGRLRRSRRSGKILQPMGSITMDTHDSWAQRGDERELRPDAVAWRAQIRELIEMKLDRLPVAYRTVFMLRAVEEMPATEVAEVLAIPEATVRTRYFRARRLLRQALADEIGSAARDAFAFDGQRCDRIVSDVLSRLG